MSHIDQEKCRVLEREIERIRLKDKDRETGGPMPPAECNEPTSGPMACREKAKTALLSKARQKRREADQLELLAAQIPDGFPVGADEMLWQLVCQLDRSRF